MSDFQSGVKLESWPDSSVLREVFFRFSVIPRESLVLENQTLLEWYEMHRWLIKNSTVSTYWQSADSTE